MLELRAYLDEPAQVPVPIFPTSLPSWQVIRAVSGKEREVADHLLKIGILTFCPMQSVVSYAKGKLQEKIKALFQNYLFAKWDVSDPHLWHDVMDSRHVLGIMGGGDPDRVDDEIIESWISRTGTDAILADPKLIKIMRDLHRGYRIGDFVTCDPAGAYIGQRLLVTEIDEPTQVVRLQIGLLGRSAVIERFVKECQLADLPSLDAPTSSRSEDERQRGGARRSRRGGRESALVQRYRSRRRRR